MNYSCTALIALTLLGGCNMSERAKTASVSGTVYYRERIALPPNSTVTVWLEDSSIADAPAELIGEQKIDNPPSVPVPFTIPYDPTKINESRRYTVRAQITSGDMLEWTSDTIYPVITKGNATRAEIMVKRAHK